jgi:hypothetical protein
MTEKTEIPDIEILRSPSPSISDNEIEKKKGRPKSESVKDKRLEQIKCMDNIKDLFINLTKGQKKRIIQDLLSQI